MHRRFGQSQAWKEHLEPVARFSHRDAFVSELEMLFGQASKCRRVPSPNGAYSTRILTAVKKERKKKRVWSARCSVSTMFAVRQASYQRSINFSESSALLPAIRVLREFLFCHEPRFHYCVSGSEKINCTCLGYKRNIFSCLALIRSIVAFEGGRVSSLY